MFTIKEKVLREKEFVTENHKVQVMLCASKTAVNTRFFKIVKDGVFVLYKFRNDQENLDRIFNDGGVEQYIKSFDNHHSVNMDGTGNILRFGEKGFSFMQTLN